MKLEKNWCIVSYNMIRVCIPEICKCNISKIIVLNVAPEISILRLSEIAEQQAGYESERMIHSRLSEPQRGNGTVHWFVTPVATMSNKYHCVSGEG